MQHFSLNYYFAIILVTVLLTQSEAKRGCALYGHSCYGGHGKRSEIIRTESLPLDVASNQLSNGEKIFSNTNKEVFYPLNNELNGFNQMDTSNDNHWKSKNEINYAVYNLLRRWIEEARKTAEETQQASEADTVFKNTFV